MLFSQSFSSPYSCSQSLYKFCFAFKINYSKNQSPRIQSALLMCSIDHLVESIEEICKIVASDVALH